MTEALSSLLSEVRLFHPWTGRTCVAVMALLVIFLWWRRTRHLRWFLQPFPLLVGALAAAACWLVVDVWWRPFAEPVGWFVWSWVGAVALMVAQLLIGTRTPGRRAVVRRRNAALVRASGSTSAVVVAGACALLAVNSFFASYPTLAAVLGLGVATVPLADLRAAAAERPTASTGGALEGTWVPPSDMPEAGQVVTSAIPAGDQSGTQGFTPRTAYIYLPPAYLSSARPLLPVVVLMAGQPGSPSSWLEMGSLKDTMDSYASKHNGLAPVMVVVDPLGSSMRNPLCSDTVKGGRVATYLETDVPQWVRSNLQVDDDPAKWAIGGLSNGATCALQVTTRSPGVFDTFLAMSPEEHPSLGGEQRTIDLGFGGDRAAYETNDPLTILASAPTGRYEDVAGIISVGTSDARYAPGVPVLAEAARRAGITVETRTYPGGHTWAVWSRALDDQLGWLGTRLGITA